MTSDNHSKHFITDVDERIKAKTAELGRKLTPQELIEVINQPDPDEVAELTYEPDENE